MSENIVPMTPRATPGPSAGTGSLPEAPTDGVTYGRMNANWSPVLPLSGGTMIGSLQLPQLIVNRNAPGLPVPPLPSAFGTTTPGIQFISSNADIPALFIDGWGAGPCTLAFRSAAGTLQAPLPVVDGGPLGAISVRGCYAAGPPATYTDNPVAGVRFYADGAFTSSTQSAYMDFQQVLRGNAAAGGVPSVMRLRNGALRVGYYDPSESIDVGMLMVKATAATPLTPPPAGSTIPRYTTLWIAGPDSGNNMSNQLLMDGFNNQGTTIACRANGGSVSSPASITAGQIIARFEGHGWRGPTTGYTSQQGGSAQFVIYAADNWSDAAEGTSFRFSLNPRGTVNNRQYVLDISDYGLWVPPIWSTLGWSPPLGSSPAISAQNFNGANYVANAYYDNQNVWRYLANNPSAGIGMGLAGTPTGHIAFIHAVPGTQSSPITWTWSAILQSPYISTDMTADGQVAIQLNVRKAGVMAGLQQVTMGAADSGGAGFRALRIPN